MQLNVDRGSGHVPVDQSGAVVELGFGHGSSHPLHEVVEVVGSYYLICFAFHWEATSIRLNELTTSSKSTPGRAPPESADLRQISPIESVALAPQ